MTARLHIESGAPQIPADVTVRVANRSTIGEQYIDLRGAGTTDKVLADGDHLVGTAESLPPPIDEVLRSGRDFAGSVPQDSLKTVIDEGYEWFRGSHDDLTRLLETSEEFAETADKNFLVTAGLIKNSSTVLSTQQESATSIKNFSSDLSLLAETLASSDGDLRILIANSPAAARSFNRLFDEVGTPLGVLMSNLVSTAQVFGTNAAGVEDALIRIPEALSIGWAINTSKGVNLGLAQTYFDPLPCTSGYGGTTVRPGLQTSGGKAFNTSAGCTRAPSTGVNVRGPKSVPKSASKPAKGKASKSGAPVAAKISVPTSLEDLMGGGE
ncbi:MlaD family protein [Aeromicrobium sp. UC242_57]|uniref:MlaD family protein n=1 Tax=Aeromicrobium sp. UC242_57 TaxID=3374624 RepID=UPI00378C7377